MPSLPNERVQKYSKKLQKLFKSLDALDDRAVSRALNLVRDLRLRILDELSQAPEGKFQAWWLPQLFSATDRLVDAFQAQFLRDMPEEQRTAWEQGALSVGEVIRELRPDLGPLSPAIPAVNLAILQGITPALIKGLGEEIKRAIQVEVSLGMLGGKSLYSVQQKLLGNKDFTTEGTHFKNVAWRAELIARTETFRARNLGVEKELEEIKKVIPDLKKIYTTAGFKVCPICVKYDGMIFEINDSKAPDLTTFSSTHPFCRCQYWPWFEGISSKR